MLEDSHIKEIVYTAINNTQEGDITESNNNNININNANLETTEYIKAEVRKKCEDFILKFNSQPQLSSSQDKKNKSYDILEKNIALKTKYSKLQKELNTLEKDFQKQLKILSKTKENSYLIEEKLYYLEQNYSALQEQLNCLKETQKEKSSNSLSKGNLFENKSKNQNNNIGTTGNSEITKQLSLTNYEREVSSKFIISFNNYYESNYNYNNNDNSNSSNTDITKEKITLEKKLQIVLEELNYNQDYFIFKHDYSDLLSKIYYSTSNLNDNNNNYNDIPRDNYLQKSKDFNQDKAIILKYSGYNKAEILKLPVTKIVKNLLLLEQNKISIEQIIYQKLSLYLVNKGKTIEEFFLLLKNNYSNKLSIGQFSAFVNHEIPVEDLKVFGEYIMIEEFCEKLKLSLNNIYNIADDITKLCYGDNSESKINNIELNTDTKQAENNNSLYNEITDMKVNDNNYIVDDTKFTNPEFENINLSNKEHNDFIFGTERIENNAYTNEHRFTHMNLSSQNKDYNFTLGKKNVNIRNINNMNQSTPVFFEENKMVINNTLQRESSTSLNSLNNKEFQKPNYFEEQEFECYKDVENITKDNNTKNFKNPNKAKNENDDEDSIVNISEDNRSHYSSSQVNNRKLVSENVVKPICYGGELKIQLEAIENVRCLFSNEHELFNSLNNSFVLIVKEKLVNADFLNNSNDYKIIKTSKQGIFKSASKLKESKFDKLVLQYNWAIRIPYLKSKLNSYHNSVKIKLELMLNNKIIIDTCDIELNPDTIREDRFSNLTINFNDSDIRMKLSYKRIVKGTKESNFNSEGILKNELLVQEKYYSSINSLPYVSNVSIKKDIAKQHSILSEKSVTKSLKSNDYQENIQKNSNNSNSKNMSNKDSLVHSQKSLNSKLSNPKLTELLQESNKNKNKKKDLSKPPVPVTNIINQNANTKTITQKPKNKDSIYYKKILHLEIVNINNKHLILPNDTNLNSGRDSLEEFNKDDFISSSSLKKRYFSIRNENNEVFVSEGIDFVFELPYIISLEINEVSIKNKLFTLNFSVQKEKDDGDTIEICSVSVDYDNSKEKIERSEILEFKGLADVKFYCNLVINSELYKDDVGVDLETDQIDF